MFSFAQVPNGYMFFFSLTSRHKKVVELFILLFSEVLDYLTN